MPIQDLPAEITLDIMKLLGDDFQTISNLSISSKTINRYFKSEPTLLIYIIQHLVEEITIYKFIAKSYEIIITP